MQEFLKKIKEKVQYVIKHFPVLFAEHLRLIFLAGVVFSFLFGLLLYKNAYNTVSNVYETSIPSHKVNTTALNEAIKHISEQNSAESIPLENPFTP